MAVSDDTKEQLGSVQTTGQPRRFVMISKGNKVTSLVVFKRGSLETQKKKAREEGKGEVSHGVVDGKGQDIKFKLLRSEGFKEAPTEDTGLKKFLKEEAEFKCAPSYEIVDELPKVEDDTPGWGVKPTVKSTDKPSQDQPQPNQPQPQTPKPTIGGGRTEALKNEFEAKLKVVMPEVHKARKVFLTIDAQRVEAGKIDPNSQLTQDLVSFIAPLNDVHGRLDSGGKVVKEAVTANNYHAAIKALDIVAGAAKTLNDKQGELIQLLSRHNAELPKDLSGDTKPSTDPQGEREVDGELNRLKKEVADTLAVKSDCTALKEAQAGLNEVFQEAVQARMDRDVQGAKFQLSLVETRLEQTKPLVAGWQGFDSEYQKHVPLLNRVDQLQTQQGSEQASIQTNMRTTRTEMLRLASEGKFKEALGALKFAVSRAEAAERQPDKEKYDAAWAEVFGEVQRIEKRIEAKPWGDPPPKGIAGLIKAYSDVKGSSVEKSHKGDYIGARELIPTIVGAIGDVDDWDAQKARDVIAEIGGATSKDEKKKALSSVKEKLTKDPDILKAISNQPGGLKLIDDLMETIGDKASSKSDKQLAMAALEARYKLELKKETSCTCGQLKGDDKKGQECPKCRDPVDEPAWTTRALPQLYKVMGMVPEKHTRGNDSLKKLTRHRKIESSLYDETEKAVVLNVPRAGGAIGKLQDVTYKFMNPFKTGKGPKLVKFFDTIALHEIGHAVDDDVDFMGKRQRMKPYGGWQRVREPDLKKVMLKQLELEKDFPTYPRIFLEKYIDALLAKEDPQKASTVQGAWGDCKMVAMRPPTRDALLADPGVLEADQVRAAFNKLDPRPTSNDEAKVEDNALVAAASNKVKIPGNKTLIYRIIDMIVYDNQNPADAIDYALSGIGAITDPNQEPDWKTLAKHKAVDWIKHVRLKGEDSGLWESKSNTEKYVVGSRVYQEAYGGQWWSYEISARGTLVSSYQFRAPGEWFAECYAAYFVGTLPDKHPVAGWLRKEEEKDTGV